MSAIFSPCGLYRRRLDRFVAPGGPVAAIFGVNPSVAGATVDDQTIRKDVGFARVHGWGRLIKGNIFDFVATDITDLGRAEVPCSAENAAHLEEIMREADVHLVAWGATAKLPKRLRTRWRSVVEIAERVGCPLMCFGTARDGHPLHTSRLPYSAELRRWTPPL